MGRSIGLDVHRDFCEVAVADGGRARSAGRVVTSVEDLELFAASLAGDDRVVLEATGNALAIARLIEPHVGEVVLANARQLKAISHARVKTDKVDARVLADLLAADLIPPVWVGDERVRMLRRLVSRRRGLVKRRTQVKNEISAVLHRNLKGRPPASDPFGRKGRIWLAAQELPADERLTVDAALRQLDFLGAELAEIDRLVAVQAQGDEDVRRLLTVPGVDVTTAVTLIAVIGDARRFPTSRQLVGYLGLHPRVRQSGSEPARHGRLSKEGSAAARHVLVEAAWTAARSPGPLHAFAARVAARRGRQVAAVAVARKLCVLCWCLLTRGEDYAFARPSMVRRKLRRLELAAGAPRRKSGPQADPVWNTDADTRERRLAEQAERAYERLVADWKVMQARAGASATPGRASLGLQ
ncbi:MAG: IS110 family transposase [Actinobacteria bacterium]|jgi:transposase|nr:IS110 family transposase [Acidobacteriota bacterium]NLT93029.1 IS110 family transposase [Actinomycetota bacterium]